MAVFFGKVLVLGLFLPVVALMYCALWLDRRQAARVEVEFNRPAP